MKNKGNLKSIAHKLVKTEKRLALAQKNNDAEQIKHYQSEIIKLSADLNFDEIMYIDEFILKQKFLDN